MAHKKSDEEKISELINEEMSSEWLNSKLKAGAIVLGVLPNSVAGRAGIRKGDAILSVDGNAIQSLMDYVKLIGKRKDIVVVDIIRNNQYIQLKLDYGTGRESIQ